MSTRKAFLDCITAKAEAQLDRTIDKITDPIRSENIKYERNLTKAKLDEYKTALGEVLNESVLPEQVKAQADALVKSYTDSYNARVRANTISIENAGKLQRAINGVALAKAPKEEVVKMAAWSTPSLRESGDIKPRHQFLSLEDSYKAESDFHRMKLAHTYYNISQEAMVFRSAESKAFGDEVTKELFAGAKGQTVSKNADAVRVAKELDKYFDDTVTEMQAYGVDLPGKGMKNYFGTKAWFNQRKILTVPEETFVSSFSRWAQEGKINIERIHQAAGKALTPQELNSFFTAIYREAQGIYEKSSGAPMTKRLTNLHKSRTMSRVIEFTEPEAVKEFDRLLGWDNFYEKVEGAVESNVRILASLKTFGVNRSSVIEAGAVTVARRFGKLAGQEFRANTEKAIKHFGGGFESKLDPNTISNIEGSKRVIASAFLGAHTAYAFFVDSLVNTPRAIARQGGSYFKAIRKGFTDITSQLGDDVVAKEIFQAQAYGEIDNLLAHIQAGVHDTQATGLQKGGSAFYKFVERASFNKLVTTMNRLNVGRDFAVNLGDAISAKTPDPKFMSFLEGFGVTRDDLIALRPALTKVKNGFTYVDVAKIDVGNRQQTEAIRKIFSARNKSLDAASPSSNHQWSAFIGASTENSKGAQLAARVMNQFMGAVMALIRQNLTPILKAPGGVKWKALAAYSMMMTTAGVLKLWFDNLRRGEDPEELSSALVLKAFLVSGATGPWGDMVRDAMSRPMGDINVNTGPLIGSAIDVAQLGIEAAMGKEGVAAKAVHKAGSFLPGGNLWWIQTLYKQGLLDHLAEMVDPDGQAKIEKNRQRSRKRRETESFFEEGRLPDFENAIPKG